MKACKKIRVLLGLRINDPSIRRKGCSEIPDLVPEEKMKEI